MTDGRAKQFCDLEQVWEAWNCLAVLQNAMVSPMHATAPAVRRKVRSSAPSFYHGKRTGNGRTLALIGSLEIAELGVERLGIARVLRKNRVVDGRCEGTACNEERDGESENLEGLHFVNSSSGFVVVKKRLFPLSKDSD